MAGQNPFTNKASKKPAKKKLGSFGSVKAAKKGKPVKKAALPPKRQPKPKPLSPWAKKIKAKRLAEHQRIEVKSLAAKYHAALDAVGEATRQEREIESQKRPNGMKLKLIRKKGDTALRESEILFNRLNSALAKLYRAERGEI